MSEQNTYKAAGVDIDAGEETVDRIKPLVRSTFTPSVMSDVGMFGACFDARFPDYDHPVLVSSVDGVGTKLKVAVMADKHDTVGHDLVNHCVNDILVCGAKPQYFMDYFATGALKPHVAENVVRGFVAGCKENDCALIGGETAEMPSMYSEGDYDLAGTIVGVVEKDRILTGQNVQKGDMLLGLASSGLHTNGYSLARHILFPKYDVNAHVDELGTSLSEALLATHRSYLSIVYPLLEKKLIRAISHVTGGGIIGNTKRVIPEGCSINIDWTSWEVPPLFQLLQSEGNVPVEDMRRTFNMGIGIILVVRPEDITTVRTMIPEQCFEIGVVE